MLYDNIQHTAHRIGTCRPSEGVPPSIGAFLADVLPEKISSNPALGITFGEIPTSTYMGVRNPNLRFIVLSDIGNRNKHLRFPADKCGVLVRAGKPKDYAHYLSEKREGLKLKLIYGWEVYDSAKFESELKDILKAYKHEFANSFFFCIHKGPVPTNLKQLSAKHLWSVKFPDTHFERDMDKSLAIIAKRDLALRDIQFMADKVEERKDIRERALAEIKAITKGVPFEISCFYIPPIYYYSGYHDTVSPLKFTLPALHPSTTDQWEQVATQIRDFTTTKFKTYGMEHEFNVASTALQAEVDARNYIIDLGRIPKIPDNWDSNELEITQNLKIRQNNMVGAFLALNDREFEWFNSAEGRPTGVKSALLSRPNLLGRGLKEAEVILNGLGYKLKASKDLESRLEKKKKFYKFQESPLHELKGHELVAYYDHGKYLCKETVINPETKETLWLKGHEYEIVPTWAKMMYAGGSEPIVNETNAIIGMEELSVRLSYLQLKVQTEKGSVTISEAQCRSNLEELQELTTDPLDTLPTEAKATSVASPIAPAPVAAPVAVPVTKGRKSTKSKAPKKPSAPTTSWIPMLDEFIQAFGLPNVPTIMELRPELLRANYQRLKKAMPDLKSYQYDCCIRNATKKGGILGGTMGSGKTRMVIGTLILRDHMFNLVIVPPMLVDNWMDHFKHYNLHAETLLSHESLNTLVERYKSLKGLPPAEKRKKLKAHQEFYVTTPEFLTLGGIGNVVYDEWTATYESKHVILDPITGEPLLDARGKRQYEKTQHHVASTRYHAKNEHAKAKLSFGTRHDYGDHIKECPKCKAKQDEEAGFTRKGLCKKCGYIGYAYKGRRKVEASCLEGHTNPLQKWIFKGHCPDCGLDQITKLSPIKEEKISLDFINELLEGTKGSNSVVGAKTVSALAYPAYRRIKGIFGAKAIDEVHLLANFNSQRGMAVFGIKTKETWVASGTIARGYVTDLEASLCHVHGANTPIFPFYPWGNGREGFREQFVTERVKTSITSSVKDGEEGKKKQTASPMPEASNLNRLRRMLNCVTTTIPDSTMEKEWKLPSIKRTYEEIWLTEENQKRYLEELTSIKSWFSGASTVERHRGALQKLWSLRLICDGEEKSQCIEKYVKQWLAEKRKFIITASTVAQYRKIRNLLDKLDVTYLSVDEKVPADKRDEVTSEFSNPKYQALISRTKLINIGLNTLVHADRLLIASLEYSPDSLRQMEKRICRPGQKSKDLQVIYPVVRMKPKSSVEEKMLKLVLEKELAVKEMLEGKVRWQSAAELLEAAKEKKGAAKVLEDIIEEGDTESMDHIFKEQTVVSASEVSESAHEIEAVHEEDNNSLHKLLKQSPKTRKHKKNKTMNPENPTPEVTAPADETPTPTSEAVVEAVVATEPVEPPKRKRGRPRKHPLPDPNAPPKKRGRPRKNPLPEENA